MGLESTLIDKSSMVKSPSQGGSDGVGSLILSSPSAIITKTEVYDMTKKRQMKQIVM